MKLFTAKCPVARAVKITPHLKRWSLKDPSVSKCKMIYRIELVQSDPVNLTRYSLAVRKTNPICVKIKLL